MRWQTTAALAVLLVALGLFYYVYEIRLGPERERAETRKGRVFTADTGDVTEAVLARKDGGTVHVKREGDAWQVLAPVKGRGARGAIEEVVTTVVTAKMDREVASAPASLADFGLDAPAAEITLTLKDGKTLGLQLGSKNPTGVWVYARERDRPAVFLLGESVLRDATRPVADFRDKTVLAFDRAAVTGLDVVTPEETLALVAQDRRWSLARPVQRPADAETIGEFLEKLAAAQVKEFAAESPASLQPYGLDRPVRVDLHTGKDKERATKTLLLGRVDTERKGIYALRPGETSVLLLPEEVWTALPRTVAAARDKRVVELDRDALTALDVESPRGKISLARDGDRWKLTAPITAAADQVEVGAVLAKALELRARAFVAEDAAGIPRYLARPEVRLTWTARTGQGPTTLLLAPAPDTRGGQAMAYAAVAGRGPVVLVDAGALAAIGRSADELRDRTLLAGLEPKDVARVRVTAGGKHVLLERKGESDWRVIEPKAGPARRAKVEDLLYTLRALRWQAVASPEGAEPAKYGLDTPSMELALLRADGSTLGSLAVGKREGERAWVRTGAGPTVYAVEARTLGETPKIPDDFQG